LNAASPGRDDRPVSAEEAEALFAGLSDDGGLLVAVSGGPDSVALLALLAEWAGGIPCRPALAAATVDHRLRAASRGEAEAVAGLCGRLGVPHLILDWDGPKPRTGIQQAARTARYRLLSEEAGRLGGATLVTAHTLDDQAETLLMRMAHGSGPAGLGGMRARTQRDGVVLARPLLGIAKTRLIATVRARGLPAIDDPSNADPRFERVRWRRLMPELAQAGLSAPRLGTLAARLRRMDEALSQRANQLAAELIVPAASGALGLDFGRLVREPDEIGMRLLARAVASVAPDDDGWLRLERLEACFQALRAATVAQTAMTRTLSGCLIVLSRRGVAVVRREQPRRRGVHPAT
jgi:tRNA(Ile)-lysidine synthase